MRRIIAFLTVATLMVSCISEEKTGDIGISSGMNVTVSFGYDIEAMGSNTKSAYIADGFDDAKISGITLAAYDHETGALHCAKHFTAGLSAMAIELYSGFAYDIYALANMGDCSAKVPESRDLLLTDFKYTVPSYSDVSVRGIPMRASIEDFTAGNSSGKVFELKRLFAKVTLNVALAYDGGTTDGIKVTNLKICNGNKTLTPFSHSRMTSASDQLAQEDYVSTDTETVSQVVFYVPENRQGQIGSATSSRDKNPDRNSAIASRKNLLTYVDVTVEADSPYYTGSVRYRSYIGENPTTNFDVKGNWAYVWNMDLTEDGLVDDDWKVDRNMTDGRYLYFTDDIIYVEPGESVLWRNILRTNLRWADISKDYSGKTLYAAIPDENGFKVMANVSEGSSMTAIFRPQRNSSSALEDQAAFRVTDKYIRFDQDVYAVNPRKTAVSTVEYGDNFSGNSVGYGYIESKSAAPEDAKWKIVPPVTLPHSVSGVNYLNYEYDALTDEVVWTPTRYATPGDYEISCSTLNGRHEDTSVLRVNDTRWINTESAYGNLPQETSIAYSSLDTSSQWTIGYSFGDLSVYDDDGQTSDSPNAGYFAGNNITDSWKDYIGYSLSAEADAWLTEKGEPTACSDVYKISSDIQLGDYSYDIYWKDTWNSEQEDYTIKSTAVLHITGTFIQKLTIPLSRSFKVGETTNVSASVTPTTASIKKVAWKVLTGNDIVDIAVTGDLTAVITGRKAGVATLKAVALDGSGAESDVMTLTVTNPPQKLEISPAQATILPGENLAYTAELILYDGSSLDVSSGSTWTSSNEEVGYFATPGSNIITGGSTLGRTSVRAQYKLGDKTYTSTFAELTVAIPEIESAEYQGETMYNLIYANTRFTTVSKNGIPEKFGNNGTFDFGKLPMLIHFKDGTSLHGNASMLGLALSSSNADVAYAYSGGSNVKNYNVIARQRGSAIITMSSTKLSQPVSIEVHIHQATLSPAPIYVTYNSSVTASFWITPYDQTSTQATECKWITSNRRIVKFNKWASTDDYCYGSKVAILGVDVPQAEVSLEYDGEYGSYVFTAMCYVNSPNSTSYRLEIEPDKVSMNVGQTIRFKAMYHTVTSGVDDGGVEVTPTWSINSGSNYIKLDAGTGTVTALAKGTAQLKASYEGKSDYATINITEAPVVMTHSFEVMPESSTLSQGQTQQLTALYHTYTNGMDDGGVNVAPSWSVVSGSGYVKVSSEGMVTALATGTAAVKATYTADGGTYTATATVTVVRQLTEVSRLEITPAETTIDEGATQIYTVRKYTDIYADGALMTEDKKGVQLQNTDITWSVISGSDYAIVNASGAATGMGSGDATIKATYKQDTSLSATAILHVDIVYIVVPGDGDNGSGGGQY